VLVKTITIMKSKNIVSEIKMKLHFFLFLCAAFFFVNHSYSQTSNKGRKVTISYKNIGYGIIGSVYKKKLVEGEEFVLFQKNNNSYSNSVKDTILNGIFHISENGNSLIKGVWKNDNGYSDEKMLVKETFIVSNNRNGKGINTDKKQTNNFRIRIKDISYLHTTFSHNNSNQFYKTITLKKQPNSQYHIRIRTGGFTLETTIPFNYEQYSSLTNFDELILS